MNKNIEKAVRNYQCPGCVVGHDTSCFREGNGAGCSRHKAGTIILGIGYIFLGMGKGFNRLGPYENMKPEIYEKFTSAGAEYNKWNIPVWKYLNPEGHTFVRGLRPRLNEPFLHIYLEDCRDKIDCLEITQSDINFMD